MTSRSWILGLFMACMGLIRFCQVYLWSERLFIYITATHKFFLENLEIIAFLNNIQKFLLRRAIFNIWIYLIRPCIFKYLQALLSWFPHLPCRPSCLRKHSSTASLSPILKVDSILCHFKRLFHYIVIFELIVTQAGIWLV